MPSSSLPPLCVDLDGTLIDGDTLIITARALLARAPWHALLLPIWLLRGRAALKGEIAARAPFDAAALPWRGDVVAFLRDQRTEGRRLILATAADRRLAVRVAEHLGIFDSVIATEGMHNAKGAGKVLAIRAALGDTPFDYIGDSIADLPVLAAARVGYLVRPSLRLEREARQLAHIERIFGTP